MIAARVGLPNETPYPDGHDRLELLRLSMKHTITVEAQVFPDKFLLDDQEGSYVFRKKAYGPYQTVELKKRDARLASRNIENYVWFMLVSHG